ncbi:cytochrome c biogenesis CcdA family protein [Humibacter sp.]|jgi:cytochrome c biogenesis protein CcdA|uniref:cytochrome c biogenesis CcdA family protein n=1 Tax=Humibacter sp. TaxID=1940291 RepID=UPI003F7F7AF6
MIGGAVIAYAFTVGLTGLINPCGLPLLPAYLTIFLDDVDRPWPARLLTALRSGGCLSLGFVAVFGVAGLVETSLAFAVTDLAPWLMLLVGAAILVLGVLSVIGKAPGWHLPALSFRSGRGAVTMIGFGAAYAIGSLSCSLPIFIAAVGSSLTTATPAQSLAVFVAYALGMGLFATAASLIAAFTGPATLRALHPVARVLPRIAGGICVIVGLYLMAYWMHVLGAPDLIAPVIGGVDQVQSAVVSWLDAWWMASAVLCTALVAGAMIALAMAGKHPGQHRRSPHRAEPEGNSR